jgi:ribonucleoside-diphosphate reductase beta chain
MSEQKSYEVVEGSLDADAITARSIQGEPERRLMPRDPALFNFDAEKEELLHATIFNTQREYGVVGNGSLLLQAEHGLLDSINKSQPRIWELYKKLKKLDWDENEFNYGECRIEFETGKKEDIEMMISTLAWQWEADSVAANHIVPILAPFVSSSELWAAYVQIGQNEIVHGLTYSEIVNNSFADGKAAMKDVLERMEAFRRLGTVGKAFAEAKRIGALITLGEIPRDSDLARDTGMKLIYALLGLERLQFMPSFAITFAFGETGRFMPIAKAVQKICNEEFSVHVEVARAVLKHEMSLAVGRASFERIKDDVAKMYAEIVENELNWTRDLFKNGQRALTGCTMDMVCDYVLYGAHDVYTTTGLPNPFKVVDRNPIGYMADWIDIDKNQASPQEEKTGNYLLGGFTETAGDKLYSVEDL